MPAVAEILPGYRHGGAHMMFAPAATPHPVVHPLRNDVRRIFDSLGVKEQFRNFDYLLASALRPFSRSLRSPGAKSYRRAAITA
jgi:tripartite-type tricarboxylate transporter receptor subunit TctC